MAISDCYPDLWIDPVEWATEKGYDVDDATQAVEEASWLMWQLSGGRFSSKYVARRDLYRYRTELRKFRLAHGPVETIFSAELLDPRDDSLSPITWTDLRGGVIRVGNSSGGFRQTSYLGGCATVTDTLLQIEYLTKPNLPSGGERQVRKLADEFYKSNAGAPCNLPERITSITRQGMTWTLLDPQDFLNQQRTGIGSIDQWLSAVNLKGYAGIIDPLTWAELAETEVIGCGQDFVPA